MRTNESQTSSKSRAWQAAEAFSEGFRTGAIVDADFDDVWETANVAALAPEHFKDDVEAAREYRDDLMDHYYDRWLSGLIMRGADKRQMELDRRENEYLRAVAASADLTYEQMTEALAGADSGTVSALRRAEESFFYR